MNLFQAALRQHLPNTRTITEPSQVAKLSKDHYWLSPILEKRLADHHAHIIVTPHDQTELQTVVRLAFTHEIPITPRGRGTGNYGQSVPLQAGLLLDTSRLTTIFGVEGEAIHAEAGANFLDLETVARTAGKELAMFPSTFKSCLGGFISGGAGGTGSVEHGFIWDNFVFALKIMPCDADAEPFWVEGADTIPYLHAYGVTGLIVEAKVKVVPARDWTALFSDFPADSWRDVAHLALELGKRKRVPRQISFDEPALLPYYPEHPYLIAGRISLRVLCDVDEVHAISQAIKVAGGHVSGHNLEDTKLLSLLSYNHPTLWAKRQRADLCHLQVGGMPIADNLPALKAILPEAMVHADVQGLHGNVRLGAIYLSRFISETALTQAITELRALGCHVINPHDYTLSGSHLPTLEDLRTYSAKNDPKGLLNPGRIPRAMASA